MCEFFKFFGWQGRPV